MAVALLQQVLVVLLAALAASLGTWALGALATRLVDRHLVAIVRTVTLAIVWCLALAAVFRLAGFDVWQIVAGPGVRILLVVGAAWLADAVLTLAIDRIGAWVPLRVAGGEVESKVERDQRVTTLARVGRRLGLAVIALVAGMMVLRELGVDISPIVAGASVAGLAISLGAQLLVRDLIAGILILAENQFSVGDVIEVGTIRGEVEAMTLRITSIRDLQGALHIVPNGELRILSNQTQSWARAVVDVEVSREADLNQTMQELRQVTQALADDPEVSPSLLEPPRITGVEALADKTMTLRVIARVKPGQQWAVARAIRLRIKTALDAADVKAQPEPDGSQGDTHAGG